MGDRGEKRRAQAFRFSGAFYPIHLLDQLYPLDRECSLVPQGIEEPPLIRRKQGAGLVAVDPHHADGAAPSAHRQEQALRAGKRIGASTGGTVVLKRPLCRGEVGVVENILRRVARLHRDGSAFGQ